jgi:hypothetical protein
MFNFTNFYCKNIKKPDIENRIPDSTSLFTLIFLNKSLNKKFVGSDRSESTSHPWANEILGLRCEPQQLQGGPL